MYIYEIKMQAERIRICSKKLLKKGFCASWYVPLQNEASVDDINMLFVRYISTNEETPYPILNAAFSTLKNSHEECMFVFMRRYTTKVLGILNSRKPMLTQRERTLLQQIENKAIWNMPIWTWTENHHQFEQTMETQCRLRRVRGHCMGIWCYR